ncbi:MAG: hypothetical protein LBK59_01090 [Bifidobacteriaceae bacterium]|jgi:hypothetical protein|nr:hypothetical protein [Bifidobacteriaceae bacterium]
MTAGGYGGWQSNPSEAPRPGAVPLRALDLGDIIVGLARCLRYAAPTILAVAATAGICNGLVEGLSEAFAPRSGNLDLWLTRSPGDGISGRTVVAGAVTGLVAVAISQFAASLIAIAVSRAVLGRRTSVAEALAAMRGRVGPLAGVVAATLGLTLGMGAGAACVIALGAWTGGIGPLVAILAALGLLVGGTYVSIHIALAPVVAVLEGVSAGQALVRAWHLAAGSAWRILGISLLASLTAMAVSIVPSIVISIPLALLATAGGGAMSMVAVGLVSAVTFTVALPIVAGVLALLYVDVRIRRENLGPVLEQAARES